MISKDVNALHSISSQDSKKPFNIGVMRLSALGDVTNALASVSAIKRHFPEAKIIWFVGKVEHKLLQDIPGIEFEIIDKKNSFSEFLRIKKKYKTVFFDALLHMQRSLRCSLIVSALRAKRVIGFDAKRARELQWLFTNEKIAKPKSPHAVDVFMEFAFKLGVPGDQKPIWDFGDFSAPESLQKLLGTPEPYISLVVCGSQQDRAWAAEKNAQLVDWALKNTNYNVCLLGGPSEFEKNHALKIIEKINSPKERIINLVGKTDLKMLKTVIKNSKALISPDTGPIHMSTALNTPTVGLYVHMPKEITGPYLNLSTTVDKYKEALNKYYGLKAPENFDGIPKRIKGYDDAINLIEVSEVIEQLKKALS